MKKTFKYPHGLWGGGHLQAGVGCCSLPGERIDINRRCCTDDTQRGKGKKKMHIDLGLPIQSSCCCCCCCWSPARNPHGKRGESTDSIPSNAHGCLPNKAVSFLYRQICNPTDACLSRQLKESSFWGTHSHVYQNPRCRLPMKPKGVCLANALLRIRLNKQENPGSPTSTGLLRPPSLSGSASLQRKTK